MYVISRICAFLFLPLYVGFVKEGYHTPAFVQPLTTQGHMALISPRGYDPIPEGSFCSEAPAMML